MKLTKEDLVNKMSKNPAKIIGIKNDILPGNIADLTIIDPEKTYEIDPKTFKSKNPFLKKKIDEEAVYA